MLYIKLAQQPDTSLILYTRSSLVGSRGTYYGKKLSPVAVEPDKEDKIIHVLEDLSTPLFAICSLSWFEFVN